MTNPSIDETLAEIEASINDSRFMNRVPVDIANMNWLLSTLQAHRELLRGAREVLRMTPCPDDCRSKTHDDRVDFGGADCDCGIEDLKSKLDSLSQSL